MPVYGLRSGKPADTTVQSPPPRRSPCSSIRKGIPLYGWKNRGEAPRRWLLSEPGLASFGPRLGTPHAHPGPSTTSLPRGNMPHPCVTRPGSQVPWARDPGNGSPSCPQRTSHFPLATLPSSSPTPASAECPGRTWGPGARAGPATVMRQVKRARAGGPHHRGRVLQGPLRPAPRLGPKSLALAQTAPPCPEVSKWTHLPPLSNICPKLIKKGL